MQSTSRVVSVLGVLLALILLPSGRSGLTSAGLCASESSSSSCKYELGSVCAVGGEMTFNYYEE